MKLKIKAGTTSKKTKINIKDTISGSPLAGLLYNSTGLTAYYIRDGQSSTVAITLATATLGTYTSGGFIAVDGTNMPGTYELGIPDAALATGANAVHIYLRGAANMRECLIEIELDAIDYQTSVPDSVWQANPSGYPMTSFTFGSGINNLIAPIYYANIKYIRDMVTIDDEFAVSWFKNGQIVTSGQLTNPAISAYNTSTGSSAFANKVMSYASSALGVVRYNTVPDLGGVVFVSGEPYLVHTSGVIDGTSRTWSNIVGLDLL